MIKTLIIVSLAGGKGEKERREYVCYCTVLPEGWVHFRIFPLLSSPVSSKSLKSTWIRLISESSWRLLLVSMVHRTTCFQ